MLFVSVLIFTESYIILLSDTQKIVDQYHFLPGGIFIRIYMTNSASTILVLQPCIQLLCSFVSQICKAIYPCFSVFSSDKHFYRISVEIAIAVANRSASKALNPAAPRSIR
jgi:hypothetical protein